MLASKFPFLKNPFWFLIKVLVRLVDMQLWKQFSCVLNTLMYLCTWIYSLHCLRFRFTLLCTKTWSWANRPYQRCFICGRDCRVMPWACTLLRHFITLIAICWCIGLIFPFIFEKNMLNSFVSWHLLISQSELTNWQGMFIFFFEVVCEGFVIFCFLHRGLCLL